MCLRCATLEPVVAATTPTTSRTHRPGCEAARRRHRQPGHRRAEERILHRHRCRVAQSLGYEVMLAADAHSTFSSPVIPADEIIAHHNRLLSGIVERVVPVAEIEF